MATIAFDFSLLSTPYRLKRCTYQLVHLLMVAQRAGQTVRAVTHKEHLAEHPIMNRIEDSWVDDYGDIDIYIAKADAFYRDDNWAKIKDLDAYKVCLCNSDMTFRESTRPFRQHKGTPAQSRCDLYMPVNHTTKLMKNWSRKVIPAAHPVDTRMIELFHKMDLCDAYLDDDIDVIRDAFKAEETGLAGFMGSPSPTTTRKNVEKLCPNWVDLRWKRKATSIEYISWVMARRAVLDLRGHGDKSLRLAEAALFGKTILTLPQRSIYSPPLVDSHNCIMVDEWGDLDSRIDLNLWHQVAEQATADYKMGWSMKAQMRNILAVAGRPVT